MMDDDYFRRLIGLDMFYRDGAFDSARRALKDIEKHTASVVEAFRGQTRYWSDDSHSRSILTNLQREISEGLAASARLNYIDVNESLRRLHSLDFTYDTAAALRTTQDSIRSMLELARPSVIWQEDWATQLRDLAGLTMPGQVRLDELLQERQYDLSELIASKQAWMRQIDVHQLRRNLDDIVGWAEDAAKLYLKNLDSQEKDEGNAIGDGEVNSALVVVREHISPALAKPALVKPDLPGLIKSFRDLMLMIKSGFLKLKPGAQIILLNVLFEILGNILTPLIWTAPEKEPPRVSKQVRVEVRKLQKAETGFPRNIRVVLASKLNVRGRPEVKSPLIGQLYAGDVVVIERRYTRSWSLVEYRDSDGEVLLRGWVFSRYLEPVNKR